MSKITFGPWKLPRERFTLKDLACHYGYKLPDIIRDNDIIQVEFYGDTKIVLAKVNIMGGVCDCCRTEYMPKQIFRYRIITLL